MWQEFDTYYLHVTIPQSSDFFNGRKATITPTKFLSCIGEDPDISREDQVLYMIGKKKKEFTDEQIDNMNRGKKDELHILRKYKEIHPTYQIYKFKDSEYPVWKEDTFIRGIPDSVIIENDKVVGIVEAKSKNHFNGQISLRDYYQVLGYMAIFGAKWCDFCVYVVNENKYVIINIEFNKDDWDNLYSKLKDFKENYLLPELKGKRYPLQPPTK